MPNSTMILDASWKDQVLTVVFNTGATYNYYEVPESIYKALMAASSMGQYLNQNVKGKYQFKRVG